MRAEKSYCHRREMVIANIASLPTRQFLVADAQWEKTSWRDSAYLRELVKPRAAKAAASGVPSSTLSWALNHEYK